MGIGLLSDLFFPMASKNQRISMIIMGFDLIVDLVAIGLKAHLCFYAKIQFLKTGTDLFPEFSRGVIRYKLLCGK